MFFIVMGFAAVVEGGFHEDEPFDKYFDLWGGVRFYTVLLFCGIVLCAFWPLVLLSLWIVALIKGW
jgi:hypothetical protein